MSKPEYAGISVPVTIFEDTFPEEIWESTYKDHNDHDVNATMHRVARFVASAEGSEYQQDLWTNRFFDMLSGFKCTAGGRIYANAGTEYGGTTMMNCLSGDTPVLTDGGIINAGDIPINSEIQVLTSNGIFERAIWKEYGKQHLYDITFSNGEVVTATAEHEWVVTNPKGNNDEKVITKNLTGRNIPINGMAEYEYHNLEEYKEGIKNGLIFGDGYVYTHFSMGEKFAALQQFGDSRHLIVDHFGYTNVTNYNGDPEGIHYVAGLDPELKFLPSTDKSSDYLRGFIAGVIAADGCIDTRGCVVLHTSVYDYAVVIRDIAMHVGIPVISLRLEREGTTNLHDKNSKLWKLTFVKKHFQDDPNLVLKNAHKEKMSKSPVSSSRTTVKCVSVEYSNRYENVYCCEQPSTHTFTLGNGLLTGNCFVSPRADHDIDSLPAIIKDIANQAMTLKSEGGWGQNFSWLRPRGGFIKGIGVETPGAVKYMEIYDKVSDVITSGSGKKSTHKKAKGKIRKGAMMGVMDVWHPDIEEFIRAKQTGGRLSKFNISVNCTDDFMKRVVKVHELRDQLAVCEDDQEVIDLSLLIDVMDVWKLRFPDTSHEHYESEWDGNLAKWESKGYPVTVFKTVSATVLWELIMESTYNRAEPGVLFLDRANYFGPLSYLETIFATNPCGEQTLAPGGVCNLGSINLTQFVLADQSGFDLERLAKYARYLNRFLDNINSLSNAPLPEYMESMRMKRRVGIGILGWGSALFMLKVRFASDRADQLREQVMSTIAREAYMSSIDLAEEKGMFEYCIPEKHAKGHFVQSLNLTDDYMEKLNKTGIRNSSLLSIQPTGNTSNFANLVSGGLEPIFMPEYVRTVIVSHMPEAIADVCPKWFEGEWFETDLFKFTKEGDEEILKGEYGGVTYKIDKNRGLTREVLVQDYGVRWLAERGEWNPLAPWAVTTENLSVDDHVRDLKGFARWVDSAMSKTVNVPQDYPFADFKDIYLDSYRSGYVKGVTTYRAGVMTAVLSAKEEQDFDEEIILEDIKVPTQSSAQFSVIKAEGKKWYLTTIMNESGHRPIAFFVHTNTHEKTVTTSDAVECLLDLARDKGIPKQWVESTAEKIGGDNNPTKIARCISLNLRHGVLIKNVVNALDNVKDVYVGTFLFQIKKYLSTWIKDGEKVDSGACPECGAENSAVYSEGCIKCSNCGYSKCG